MGRLSTRTETPSWPTPTPICRCRAAESSSPRQCIILCDSTAETECTRDICRVIPLRTAACACRSNTRLHFLMRFRLGLPSLFSAGRPLIATTQVNRSNQVFHAGRVLARSWAAVSGLRLPHPACGGDKIEISEQRCNRTALSAVMFVESPIVLRRTR